MAIKQLFNCRLLFVDIGESFLVKFGSGVEATSPVPYPLDSKKIKYVSAGGSHTMFLTSNVYEFFLVLK